MVPSKLFSGRLPSHMLSSPLFLPESKLSKDHKWNSKTMVVYWKIFFNNRLDWFITQISDHFFRHRYCLLQAPKFRKKEKNTYKVPVPVFTFRKICIHFRKYLRRWGSLERQGYRTRRYVSRARNYRYVEKCGEPEIPENLKSLENRKFASCWEVLRVRTCQEPGIPETLKSLKNRELPRHWGSPESQKLQSTYGIPETPAVLRAAVASLKYSRQYPDQNIYQFSENLLSVPTRKMFFLHH